MNMLDLILLSILGALFLFISYVLGFKQGAQFQLNKLTREVEKLRAARKELEESYSCAVGINDT